MNKPIWNLPNILTILRILFSPVFLYFLLIGKVEIALVVFMFVAVTDFADGWIARTAKQKTKFGEALDPMADKFMIFLALIGVSIKFDFPLIAIPFFISRDIISLAGSVLIYAKNKGLWKPNIMGKITTFLQIICIILYIITDIDYRIRLTILYVTIISSVIAAIIYGVRWLKILLNKNIEKA